MTQSARWIFCFLTGCLSVLFAEIFLGSFPAAFTSVWGLIGVYPIYALHILLLLSIAFSRGLPNLRTLYALGALFGLYEAYLTKVLWVNPWGDLQLHLAGVSWFAVLALVFYWHPLMSFILPAFAAEWLLTTTPAARSIVPAAWHARFQSPGSKARLALVLGAMLGLNQAGQTQQAFASLRGLPDALLLTGAIWWWQSTRRRAELSELLPSAKASRVLAGILIVFFVLVGAGLRVEVFPGPVGQLVILALYGVFAWMAWRGLQSPKPAFNAEMPEAPFMHAKYLALLVVACYGTSAVVQVLLPTARIPLFGLFLVAGMLAGIWLVVVNVLSALGLRRPGSRQAIDVVNPDAAN